MYGFQADDEVCVASEVTGDEVTKAFAASELLNVASSALLATAALSSNTSWLPSLSSGELFSSSLGFSVLFGATVFIGGAWTAMLFACSMVGHSEEDDGIAA